MSAPTPAPVPIAIYLFDQVEVLDFAGPYEVFTTAVRVARRLDGAAPPPFAVHTFSAEGRPITARAGLPVIPDHSLNSLPTPAVLLIPGGVVDAQLAQDDLLARLKPLAHRAELVLSVCTGAFILGRLGLLAGRRVTTHWEDIPDLRRAHPEAEVIADTPWVDETPAAPLITSAGIAAGIDMSLHVVARLAGEALAVATARQLEYPWQQNAGTRRGREGK